MDVRLPDGTVIRNVPEGTTQEELMARLQAYQARPKEPDASMRGYNPPARNLLSSAAHGGLDAAGGIAQIVSRAAEGMGLPPGSDYPFVASPDVVEQSLSQARGKVNKALGAPQPDGMDLMRGVSGAALVAPFQGPVGTAGTMAGRGLQAGRAGAIQGAAQPVENAKDGMDFAKTKAFQTVTGAGFGALAQPALEMGAQGVARLANAASSRASGMARDTTEEAATRIAYQVVAQQGVKWNELSEGVQKSLVKDVQEALKKYGGVDPKALGRQSDFKALGIDPLKPWVTRDPVEWGQYKNLEMAKDAGEPLIRAGNELSQKLMGRLESLRGPNAGDAYQAGSRAETALSRTHEVAKGRTEALYAAFRNTAPNVAADPKRMVDTILDSVERDALGDFLGPLRNLINDFATGKRPTTPDSLYRAQQVANAVARKGGPEAMAARRVVDGIDNELEQMGRDMALVGPEMAQAAGLLKQARAAHRNLKMTEEAIPALRDVAEGKYAAEDFFNRYILGGDVKEVAAMWAKVPGQEIKQAARSQLIDFLKKKAAGGGADDGAFRQGNFTEALSGPGMTQKIRILLGDKGLAEVQRVQRAAEAAIRTPAGARYNTSGTAMELANLAGRVPVIGDVLRGMGRQMQVSGMSNAGPSAIGKSFLDPFMEEILKRSRRGAGLLSSFGAGATAGELTGN